MAACTLRPKLKVRSSKLQLIQERTWCRWQRNLPMKFAFLTKRKKAMSNELMLRAYQSMELHVMLTYKLGHGKVRLT